VIVLCPYCATRPMPTTAVGRHPAQTCGAADCRKARRGTLRLLRRQARPVRPCQICGAPIRPTGKGGRTSVVCKAETCRSAKRRADAAAYHRRVRGAAWRADISERYARRNAAARGETWVSTHRDAAEAAAALREEPAEQVERLLAQARARRLARRYLGTGRAA
jgi:hypothetical protein